MTMRDILDSATEREKQVVQRTLRAMWLSRERMRRRRRKVAVARAIEELGASDSQTDILL